MAVTVFAGPPCAGKSTRARELGVPVLDWDDWYAARTGRPLHLREPADPAIASQVERQFQAAIATAAAAGRDAAVIRAAPERWHRGMLRRLYRARVIVLEVPIEECLRRLAASARPAAVHAATERAIRDWWARYEPSPHDIVERPSLGVA